MTEIFVYVCLQHVYVPIEFIIMSDDYNNVEESAVYGCSGTYIIL